MEEDDNDEDGDAKDASTDDEGNEGGETCMRWKSSKLPAMMGIGRERTSTPGQLIEDADSSVGH